MNIFGLARHPAVAASMHCDVHIIKMIVETAQILYTYLRSIKLPLPIVLDDSGNVLPSYGATHATHPCVLWLHGGYSHVAWLLNLGLSLCDQYTLVYTDDTEPELKTHATQYHLVALRAHLTKEMLPADCDAPTWLQRLAKFGIKSDIIDKCAGKVATFNPPKGCAFGVVCIADNTVELQYARNGQIDLTNSYKRLYAFKRKHRFSMLWNRKPTVPKQLR